jgi:hypothetical protein
VIHIPGKKKPAGLAAALSVAAVGCELLMDNLISTRVRVSGRMR